MTNIVQIDDDVPPPTNRINRPAIVAGLKPGQSVWFSVTRNQSGQVLVGAQRHNPDAVFTSRHEVRARDDGTFQHGVRYWRLA